MARFLSAWPMIRFLISIDIFHANPTLIHATCDCSTVYAAYDPRTYNNYFLNSSVCILYNFQKPSSTMSDLAAIDKTCDTFCTSRDARFYGRSGVIRSADAFDEMFAFIASVDKLGVTPIPATIGAIGDLSADSLIDFSWTATGTNVSAYAMSQINARDDNVTSIGTVPAGATRVLAFNFANTGTRFFSYAMTSIKDNAYICECGCAPFKAPITDTSTSSSATASATSMFDCAKTYEHTAPCIIEPPDDSYPNVGRPQDCANMCTSTIGCRSFNFRLGDATCSHNKCELFSKASTEVAAAGLSTAESECIHYDNVV